ncbi:TIGR00296 family protein [Methanobrevibacter sp. TMH8]|uniref:TIGR00296 family protein n=1 Tax=Methanobrevibacter sp. TMH8 TaxID=2848611 RepID=UPI001CCE0494|nr:TIGR00296 family protein [Methanobrevibacter sp. TMH8]MBZ9570309.1 TIGR00296 family protein [Methanobrevibacter sp. TMH8]
MLSKKDGDYLIKIAKLAVETYLKKGEKINVPKDCPEHLKEDLGVFVTLNKNNELRGCIGYPEPIAPLINATIDVAISAAVNDPRFPSLTEEELKYVDFEVTVLTKPELLQVDNPSDYLKEITIGKDGLIVENGFSKGLLLPQVATEYNMDVETFLANTCMKAGLSTECWLKNETKIYTFQGQIFKE